MELIIAIIGAISAIIIAIIGAILSYRHNNALQVLKLKEEHYVSYIEALHNLCVYNTDKEYISKYTYCRDKLLIVGSEDVVKAILLYEEEGVGKTNELHDKYITDIVINIRKDLKIKDKQYPNIYFKK